MGPALASELESVYFGNGIHTKEPTFLNYCDKFSKSGHYHICLLQNPNGTCRGWAHGLPLLSKSAIPIRTEEFYQDFLPGTIEVKELHKRIASWSRSPGDEQALAGFMDYVTTYMFHILRTRNARELWERQQNAEGTWKLAADLRILRTGEELIAGAHEYLRVLEEWLQGGRR